MPELPSSPFDFHGYSFVVTGGSRGIGRSVALALARVGAAVSICVPGAKARNEIRMVLVAHGAAVRAVCRHRADAVVVVGHVEDAAATLDGAGAFFNNGAGHG